MSNLDFWRSDRGTPRSLLDEVFGALSGTDYTPVRYQTNTASLTPACDIAETENAFLLNFDIPGLKKEDIHIEVKGHQLAISGERKREDETKNNGFHRVERSFGKFTRSFDLPEGTNTDVIEASYENGVLKVAIPKAESKKARKIEIGETPKGFLKNLTSRSDAKVAHA